MRDFVEYEEEQTGYVGKYPAIGVYYFQTQEQASNFVFDTDDSVVFIGGRSRVLLDNFNRYFSIDNESI